MNRVVLALKVLALVVFGGATIGGGLCTLMAIPSLKETGMGENFGLMILLIALATTVVSGLICWALFASIKADKSDEASPTGRIVFFALSGLFALWALGSLIATINTAIEMTSFPVGIGFVLANLLSALFNGGIAWLFYRAAKKKGAAIPHAASSPALTETDTPPQP